MLVVRALFVWGAMWWFGGGIAEIERHVSGNAQWNAERSARGVQGADRGDRERTQHGRVEQIARDVSCAKR